MRQWRYDRADLAALKGFGEVILSPMKFQLPLSFCFYLWATKSEQTQWPKPIIPLSHFWSSADVGIDVVVVVFCINSSSQSNLFLLDTIVLSSYQVKQKTGKPTSIGHHVWSTTLCYKGIEIYWIDPPPDPVLAAAVSRCCIKPRWNGVRALAKKKSTRCPRENPPASKPAN